jgi:uncharacterized protein (TIGR02271 family)
MQRILSKLPRWELDHEEDDIRGWPLRDANGHMIGTISELVADTDTQCISQLIVANGRRIPAHDVVLGDHVVTLAGATSERAAEAKARDAPARLAAVPAAAHAAPAEMTPLARPKKTAPVAQAPVAQAPVAQAPVAEVADVIIPLVDEELEIAKRQVEAGGVRVQTRIVTQSVRREVPVREEHVTIERRKVDEWLSPADADAQLHDRAVEIKATSEQPFAVKRAHAVEELVLKKERTERTQEVEDTVRHTEAEVMDLGAKDGSKPDKGARP